MICFMLNYKLCSKSIKTEEMNKINFLQTSFLGIQHIYSSGMFISQRIFLMWSCHISFNILQIFKWHEFSILEIKKCHLEEELGDMVIMDGAALAHQKTAYKK